MPTRSARQYLSLLFALSACCALTSLVFVLGYVHFFENSLYQGNIEGERGFVGLYITDTLIYIDLLMVDEWSILAFAIAGVKNAFVPVLFWQLAQGSWYVMAAINAAFLYAILSYLCRLCWHFNVPQRRAAFIVALLAFLPSVQYFSVGSLKELPTLLALTGFLYHFLKGQKGYWFLWALVLILLRYQLGVLLMIFIFCASFSKSPLRMAALLVLGGTMAYPFFSHFGILSSETTEFLREETDSQASAGALLESIRETVPIASAAAVLVRALQSLMEPIITLIGGPYLFYDGAISIEGFAYLSALILTVPSWVRTAAAIFRGLLHGLPRDTEILYSLILIYGVLVGGLSFVQGRYLFPATALVLLGGVLYQQRHHKVPLRSAPARRSSVGQQS